VESVGPAEINRILVVMDSIGVSREHVVVPLGTKPGGLVRFNARKKIEITAPESGFDDWLKALPQAIHRLDHPEG